MCMFASSKSPCGRGLRKGTWVEQKALFKVQALLLFALFKGWSAFAGCQGPQRSCRPWLQPRHSCCVQLNAGDGDHPGRVVFLGSPSCVEVVLQRLVESQGHDFEVCAVVSRPPKRVKKAVSKTAVHDLAEKLGVPCVLTPPSAKDPGFLEELESLKPDVCVTAAYGEYLPRRFLQTPRLGTVNLHPSLLPRWRGASPVQRCLVAGDTETGITILYTVPKMDAGPIIVQKKMSLQGSETSPDLLDKLFAWGADLLVDQVIPKLLSGEVTMDTAQVQDEALVEKAPIITKEEGRLWPHNETAMQMRDKVRGYAGWPGTTLPVACSGSTAPLEGVRIKVADAEIVPIDSVSSFISSHAPDEELFFIPEVNGRAAVGLRPACDKVNALLLRSFHIPGKKHEVPAETFKKGYMSFQPAKWITPEEEAAMVTTSSGGTKKKRKRTRGPRQ
ncbi:unnamed protein product [Durusdinium trenchii]|uniref:Methionyl-tRNA formyltransferase, mitochondrial n=2 Tax=Durusdinium trenchii TaxID=1381693 RepID=A0ABP0HC33_9DINO